MRAKISASLILLIFIFVHSSNAQGPDAVVIVRQSTLNGFLNAVGPVSGKAPYSVLGLKGEYTWTVKNARIDLKPNAADFAADASVNVGVFCTGRLLTVRWRSNTTRKPTEYPSKC